MPAAIPVTVPEGSTTAVSGDELLQVPPDGVLPSAVVRPMHTLSAPVIADGSGLIVIVAVAVQPPGGNV